VDPSNDLERKVGNVAYDAVTSLANLMVTNVIANETQRNLPVQVALNRMQRDMDLLDNVAGRTPQLTRLELTLLFSTIFVSAISPAIVSVKVVEVLVPSMAALSAAVGISAEYVGKVAVSNGKEIAALAIQAAAEAESILAQAERAKAILPLCVGISTTSSAFALLIPSLVNELKEKISLQFVTEVFLICPLISVLGAAIAGLATAETLSLASRASGVGNRRFASAGSVGITWLSQTEQVEAMSMRSNQKWQNFGLGVLPAPLIAVLCPGSLAFRAIVCAAIAAAQAAYLLSVAEYSIASATDAVAIKSRAAAISDTYANQGSRAGAVLPFTSALAGLCAAASAAAVELLPLVGAVEIQSLIALLFPTGAAMFAAAASVSKARCEVDAAAASAAASSGLSSSENQRDPKAVVMELILCTLQTTQDRLRNKYKQVRSAVFKSRLWRWIKNIVSLGSGGGGNVGGIGSEQKAGTSVYSEPYTLSIP